ncbi:MAG: hypothetical protein ICV68_13685, partial [Pyrinomonadaceae bacterium]|nr:hypothetical protein [Pyrinomonadaceae bacterium]
QNHFRPPDATVSPYPVLLPLAAAVADYLENLIQLLILRRYQAGRTRASALVIFSVMMTAIKILLWLVSVLLIIAGLLKLALE